MAIGLLLPLLVQSAHVASARDASERSVAMLRERPCLTQDRSDAVSVAQQIDTTRDEIGALDAAFRSLWPSSSSPAFNKPAINVAATKLTLALSRLASGHARLVLALAGTGPVCLEPLTAANQAIREHFDGFQNPAGRAHTFTLP